MLHEQSGVCHSMTALLEEGRRLRTGQAVTKVVLRAKESRSSCARRPEDLHSVLSKMLTKFSVKRFSVVRCVERPCRVK
jgi:hypothetical protein